jgi:hypothetical protein
MPFCYLVTFRYYVSLVENKTWLEHVLPEPNFTESVQKTLVKIVRVEIGRHSISEGIDRKTFYK